MSTERRHNQLSFLAPSDIEVVELMRHFVREASRIYGPERGPARVTEAAITGPGDAYHLLRPDMEGLAQEELRLLTLTTKQQVISSPTVYVGNLSTAIVRPAEVYRHAILDCAAGIIVAHNHPSGDPEPSPEDISITRQLVDAGRLLDIRLLDHLIIGDGRYVSLKERGLLR